MTSLNLTSLIFSSFPGKKWQTEKCCYQWTSIAYKPGTITSTVSNYPSLSEGGFTKSQFEQSWIEGLPLTRVQTQWPTLHGDSVTRKLSESDPESLCTSLLRDSLFVPTRINPHNQLMILDHDIVCFSVSSIEWFIILFCSKYENYNIASCTRYNEIVLSRCSPSVQYWYLSNILKNISAFFRCSWRINIFFLIIPKNFNFGDKSLVSLSIRPDLSAYPFLYPIPIHGLRIFNLSAWKSVPRSVRIAISQWNTSELGIRRKKKKYHHGYLPEV